MADLNFAQPERRSFLIPGLIVALLVGAAFFAVYRYTPHSIAEITVTHTAILPTHTVFKSGSIVVNSDTAQDDLYVAATVHIEDKLKLPIFLKDLTGTLTHADGTVEDSSAVQKNDIPSLYITFPDLKPLGSAPLLRETEIQPGHSAEGMVLLHFSATKADWDNRKSATIGIDLYHQGIQTVTIPKP